MSFPHDLTGTRLDRRYQITGLLGKGGMGHVYDAMHVGLEQRVAIKVLHPRFATEERFRERFIREARSASKIRHRNVVRTTDFGETPDGSVYFVMEYLEGRDVGEELRAEGAMAWPRVRHILLQAVGALRAAHAQDIIHRDVKPGNCFLTVDKEEGIVDFVKVLDFGIAKVGSDSQADAQGKGLTGTGEVFGTATYMSPEQARGGELDARSDMYSLGIMAYEMLCGRVPFTGVNSIHVITRHLNDPPAPLRSHDPKIPAEVEALVLKTIAKEPAGRFESMSALEHALRSIPEAAGQPGRRTRIWTAGSEPNVPVPARSGTLGSVTVPRAKPVADTVERTAVVSPLAGAAGAGGVRKRLRIGGPGAKAAPGGVSAKASGVARTSGASASGRASPVRGGGGTDPLPGRRERPVIPGRGTTSPLPSERAPPRNEGETPSPSGMAPPGVPGRSVPPVGGMTSPSGMTPPRNADGTHPPPGSGDRSTPPPSAWAADASRPPPGSSDRSTPPPSAWTADASRPPPGSGDRSTPPPSVWTADASRPPPGSGDRSTPPPSVWTADASRPPPGSGDRSTPPPSVWTADTSRPPPGSSDRSVPPPSAWTSGASSTGPLAKTGDSSAETSPQSWPGATTPAITGRMIAVVAILVVLVGGLSALGTMVVLTGQDGAEPALSGSPAVEAGAGERSQGGLGQGVQEHAVAREDHAEAEAESEPAGPSEGLTVQGKGVPSPASAVERAEPIDAGQVAEADDGEDDLVVLEDEEPAAAEGDGQAKDAGHDGETPAMEASNKTPAASKRSRPGHETAECSKVRDDAEVAYRSWVWGELHSLTRKRECWSPAQKTQRLRLYVRALLELQRFSDCVKAGRDSKDAEIQKMVRICEKNAR